MIALLAWVFVVDSLLFGLVPTVGRFMPTAAMNALLGETDPDLVSGRAAPRCSSCGSPCSRSPGVALTARRDVS